MSRKHQFDHSTKWIEIKFISVVWSHAQRKLNKRAVKKMVDEFDPDAFGEVSVSLANDDGKYHCIDGQTRIEAVRLMWGEDEKVPCNVLNAADPQRAAQIFSLINSGRTKPQAVDRFNVAVTAGHKTEVAITTLIEGLGYHITANHECGAIHAVQALLKIYAMGGGGRLSGVLLVVYGTWGRENAAVDGPILEGYAAFLKDYGDQIKKDRLVTGVGEKFTAGRLLGEARGLRHLQGGSVPSNVRRILVMQYNKKLRKNRLTLDDA